MLLHSNIDAKSFRFAKHIDSSSEYNLRFLAEAELRPPSARSTDSGLEDEASRKRKILVYPTGA